MVIIMTLIVVCAVFAILGGLAFTEVHSLQLKLQEKQRQYDDAVTAIDTYRARVELHNKRIEFYRTSNDVASECVGTLSKMDTLHRGRIEELTKELNDYKLHAKVAQELIERQTVILDRYTDELKVLRSQFNEHELLKQQHHELVQRHQMVMDSLPDWAGGGNIDDEYED
jgi:chromosome segregation ATPase